jgi:hypothetical protein
LWQFYAKRHGYKPEWRSNCFWYLYILITKR